MDSAEWMMGQGEVRGCYFLAKSPWIVSTQLAVEISCRKPLFGAGPAIAYA